MLFGYPGWVEIPALIVAVFFGICLLWAGLGFGVSQMPKIHTVEASVEDLRGELMLMGWTHSMLLGFNFVLLALILWRVW
jgi:hypothetical protein